MKKLNVNDKFPAIGPYSIGIQSGSMIFLSGQLPINPDTKEIVAKDIALQTTQIMNNIKEILGDNFNNIVKTTIYMSDLSQFDKMNEIYQSYFKSIYPARTCIEVSRLPKDSLIEIECIVCEAQDLASLSNKEDK